MSRSSNSTAIYSEALAAVVVVVVAVVGRAAVAAKAAVAAVAALVPVAVSVKNEPLSADLLRIVNVDSV